MVKQLLLRDRVIFYELTRKNVKNINLRIKPDLTISVSANPRVKQEFIENFMISKSEWIEKTLQRLEERRNVHQRELQIIDGDTIRLLGTNYTVRILSSKTNKVSLEDNNCICINATDTDHRDKLKSLWNKWFEAYIRETFLDIVHEVYPLFAKYQIPNPEIKLRNMKTRWGTCAYHKGIITLNKKLIHMPIECIEYVVMHEFTHFIHPNHGKEFYRMLSTIMPDYKERKKLLEEQAVL